MYNDDRVPSRIPIVIMKAKLKTAPPPTNNNISNTDSVVAVVITVRLKVFCNASFINSGIGVNNLS